MEPVPLVHASVGCVVVAYVVRCRMLVPYLLGLRSLLVFFSLCSLDSVNDSLDYVVC